MLASGQCWSPHLLLLSANERFPNGIANRSGLVGRYMNGHKFISAQATIDAETFPGQNMTHSLISREFFRCATGKPFVRHDTRVWESSAGKEPRLRIGGRTPAPRRRAPRRLAIACAQGQRTRSPVVEELVAESTSPPIANAAPAELQTRVSCRTNGLPVAQRKKLARNQAVRHVLAGERFCVNRRLRGNELVTVHVAADEAQTIGNPFESAHSPHTARVQLSIARRDTTTSAAYGSYSFGQNAGDTRAPRQSSPLHRRAQSSGSASESCSVISSRRSLLIGVVRRIARARRTSVRASRKDRRRRGRRTGCSRCATSAAAKTWPAAARPSS